MLNAYRRSVTYTDVVLQVDGCEFPCHCAILCASSAYFLTMFCSHFQESRQAMVRLQGISRNTMEHLLNFMYEGKLKLDEENVKSVFQTADQLDVPSLSVACQQYLEKCVSPSNCLSLLDFTRSSSLVDPAFFISIGEADELVLDCVDCRPLLHEARMYHVYGRELRSACTRPWRRSGWAEMICVIGGCDRSGFSRLSFTEKFSHVTGDWLSAAALPGDPKSEFAACELQNDIYLSGGQLNSTDVWRFMSQLNQWVCVCGLCRSRWRHNMVSLCGSCMLLEVIMTRCLSSVECYNPHNNS